MTVVAQTLLPIFALIGFGLFLRRRGIVPEDNWPGVEKICYWLFFPALLAKTLIEADLSAIPVGGLTGTLLFAVLTMTASMLAMRPLLARHWGMKGPAYTSVFQTSSRWNGFIALAVIIKLFGTPGVAMVAVAMAVMVPLINFENVIVMATFVADERPGTGRVVRMILVNPLIWGCLIGIAVNALGVPVWAPVMTLLDLLGRAALGVGLLCVGAGLRLRHALRPSRAVWLATAMKLFAMPLFVAAWGLVFGLSGMAFQTAIVCAAVPTAMHGFILARLMGGDAELYAATVTVQTALSAVSIPMLLIVAAYYSPIVP